MFRRDNIIANIDWITIVVYVLLVFMGWLNIYAAVYNEQHSLIFDTHERYGLQLIWIGLAFFLAFLIFMVDLKFYPFFAYIIYGITILLLILVLVFGREVNGARAWLKFGVFTIQPGEFAKLGTALAIAKYFSTQAAIRASLNAINIHGAYGVMEDYMPHHFYKHAPLRIGAGGTDELMKNMIAASALGLDTVAQLRPVTFDWTSNGEHDLGFVAEEVDQVTPLLTTRNAEDQIEGVKYDRISAVLVKAVQEQQQQIAALQQQNAELQARLAAPAAPLRLRLWRKG